MIFINLTYVNQRYLLFPLIKVSKMSENKGFMKQNSTYLSLASQFGFDQPEKEMADKDADASLQHKLTNPGISNSLPINSSLNTPLIKYLWR